MFGEYGEYVKWKGIFGKIRGTANYDQNNVCNSQKLKNILEDKKCKIKLKKYLL